MTLFQTSKIVRTVGTNLSRSLATRHMRFPQAAVCPVVSGTHGLYAFNYHGQRAGYSSTPKEYLISKKELKEKLTANLHRPKFHLIDVRRVDEYVNGAIGSAKLIPVETFPDGLLNDKTVEKTDEIVFYCRSGKRSLKALEAAKSMGYTKVKHYDGGWLGWAEN